jgi:nicotinamide-nucleotide amidase
VLTYGLPESELAEKIADWENNLPSAVKLAYLPSPGRVRLRLSMKGQDEDQLVSEINNQIEKLKIILGDLIFGYDDEPIENIVAKLLIENSKTVCTAESFTGGKIASMLTSVPGSSKYYNGSVVCYATQSKIDVLNVDAELIKNKTVVSREVAQQMAENARTMFDTDFCISATGVAGPDKGEDGKEIGTAYIALATKSKTLIQKYNFGQPREKMQGRAVAMAFDMLRKELI